MKTRFLLFIALYFICLPARAETEDSIALELSVSHENNLNRSQSENSALDDSLYFISGEFSRAVKLNRFSYTRFHAFTSYQQLQEFDGLNNIQVGAGVNYSIKPSLHFTDPTYSLNAEISVTDFETDIRDATTLRAGASMSFWATTVLSFRSGLTLIIHDSDSRIYDRKNLRLFFSSDYRVNNRISLYGTLSLITGDSNSTIPLSDASSEVLDVIRQAEEIEIDPTFDDNMIGYRLDADVITFTLGYNHTLAPRQSIDLSIRSALGMAEDNVEYKNTLINLSYLVSFGL